MYTFARSKLLLTEKEFWDMYPKTFFAMEREWYRMWTIEQTGQWQPLIDYDEDKSKSSVIFDPTIGVL